MTTTDLLAFIGRVESACPPLATEAVRLRNEIEAVLLKGEDVARDFVRSKSPKTEAEYGRDIELFAEFIGASSSWDAISKMAVYGPEWADSQLRRFRLACEGRGLAPRTINRRMSAVASTLDQFREQGLIGWRLRPPRCREVDVNPCVPPSPDVVARCFADLAMRTDTKGRRDLAMLRVLFENHVGPSELAELDLAHVDLKNGTISLRSGHIGTGRVTRGLSGHARAALTEWRDMRGAKPGPLFTNLDRAKKGAAASGRLTVSSIYHVVQKLGDRIGFPLTPRAVLHASRSIVHNETGNAEDVQHHARRKGPVLEPAREAKAQSRARRASLVLAARSEI